jgi:hypothetical protein
MIKIHFFLFFCHEDMLENILGLGCMHENKTLFCFFFFLLKTEINLKVLRFLQKLFLEIFQRKPSILKLDLYFTV